MVAATFDLNNDRIIEQGSYWEMTIKYPGNVTGAFLRGQIRKDYGGDLLAEFRFEQPTYNEESDQTSFPVLLNAPLTKKIPLPEGESPFWRYDLYITLPGKEPKRLLQGKVFISPAVSQ